MAGWEVLRWWGSGRAAEDIAGRVRGFMKNAPGKACCVTLGGLLSRASIGKMHELIVGGADHKQGKVDDGPDRFRWLEDWTRRRFPIAEVDYRWSGMVMENFEKAVENFTKALSFAATDSLKRPALGGRAAAYAYLGNWAGVTADADRLDRSHRIAGLGLTPD